VNRSSTSFVDPVYSCLLLWVNGVSVRTVQRGRSVQGGLTALAVLLLVLALNLPHRLDELAPVAFLRLPLELVVYVAVVLAVPPHLVRTRTVLAVAAGVLLAVTTVVRVLDLGFREVLNRPFDTVTDWGYAGSFVETVRGSVEGGLGETLLVATAAGGLALLLLLPLAVLRVTRATARRRTVAVRLVAALVPLWLVLALLDVHGGAGALASRETAGYVAHQVGRVPAVVRDQREFAEATRTDPLDAVPARRLLAGLRGRDVLVVFVESYGRVAVEGSSFAPGVTRVLTEGERELARAGFSSRSAFLTSPTFGAISWLAHATLQSGLWVDSQRRYDVLVESPRLTLSRLFGRAGWRTVGDVPANTRDWPQAAFYGFDHLYDSRNVGYRGPRFGYPPVPDQYTLSAFHRLELAHRQRRPVMAEIDLVTSHAPWSRTPWMVDWSAVGDGSVFDGMPAQLPSAGDIWPSPERVRAAYGAAVEYSLTALLSFVATYGDDDLVVVLVGDHQPSTIVSGEDPGFDVPVSVIARDPELLEPVASWGWDTGLVPAPDARVWRMDAFRDRFVEAYSDGPLAARPPGGQTEDRARSSG
jgi:hypothetical protein